MNKFNQWFATMPTWQFLTLLATMMGLMIGLHNALHGWSITFAV